MPRYTKRDMFALGFGIVFWCVLILWFILMWRD